MSASRYVSIRESAWLRALAGPGRGGNLAFAVVVLVAYVTVFTSPAPGFGQIEAGALLLAGLAYLVNGLYGFGPAAEAKAPLALLIYFAVEISLGTGILYLSQFRGAAWLILLPLAAQAVTTRSRRWTLAICALLMAVLMGVVGLLADWPTALQSGLAYLSGIVFVVVFTQLAVREGDARAQVERLAAELAEANRKLREYAVQVEELATAKERNRLAREIHDSLGHYLTVINVQLEAARTVMAADPARVSDALRKAQSLAQDGLAEVRRSVAALRLPPIENRPLPEAVRALVDECRAAGIVSELNVVGSPRPLPAQVELTLYRAAQEGLTNVRKHARASRADVTLDYRDPARVQVSVQDNGLGMDGPRSGSQDGFGLLGLRERAQLLGGEVRVRTASGQGFTLEVEVPG